MKIGDKVQWLDFKKTRNGYSFTMKEGKLVELATEFAHVKIRGKSLIVAIKDLQVVGSGPNQLTKLMRGK